MAYRNEPYGGKLVNLLTSKQKATVLRKLSAHYKSWTLTHRQLCDIELLLNGGFSPLTGFMNKADYDRVCTEMRLADGTLWPMPVTLDVDELFAQNVQHGERIALRDPEGVILAILEVDDVWRPDKVQEARQVFDTNDQAHPAVAYLHNQAGEYYIGGKLIGLELPRHYDFTEMRLTPHELREHFHKMGWHNIVAFQTRNPLHRSHVEILLRAAKKAQAAIVIHPSVGMTKPGDVDHYSRVRVYQKVMARLPASTLALLPLAMRMGGPREAVWHAIIRKNYGATHFIVGRDHAGPGKNTQGEDFYDPLAAMDLAQQYAAEIGIEIIEAGHVVYAKNRDSYVDAAEATSDTETLNISGTELRARLADGRDIPEWFSYPEVVEELRKAYPPRHRRGVTVFFTGLSGAGKSTIAHALQAKLLERGSRQVTLLDGDMVRKHLSSELGFSKTHRDLNVRRIGFVAAEVTKHGGIALCAPIAPYDVARKAVRAMVTASGGGFVLAHVATPITVCEQRDRKGLYAAARQGKIKEFTGVSDPYEEPADAELTVSTEEFSAAELANQVLTYLEKAGYIELLTDGNS